MRVINKQISLENLTSRLPGVVPAYRERDGKTYYFDEESLKARDYTFPSNYDMIPKAVKVEDLDLIKKIKHNDEILFSKKNDNNCNCIIPRKRKNNEEECGIVLSWETISEWYSFFTDYYLLLNKWGHCNTKYKNAVDYYDHESKGEFAPQMVYGTFKDTYEELDALYEDRGGSVMYNYLTKKIVPTMNIPSKYVDYWHTTKLFYPDYIKWRGWFENRHSKYGEYTDASQCSGASDCCDCNEYFNRGGNDMYATLTSTTFSIPSPSDSDKFCDPYMSTDISLLVSIDDMGEFSIFSEEYEVGKDYRVAGMGNTENKKGGTVVSIDGKAKSLKNNKMGYSYDNTYKEKIKDDSSWSRHVGRITVSNVPEEDNNVTSFLDPINFKYYGFKPNMAKVTGNTREDVVSQLKEKYPIEDVNSFYIDGILYDIIEEEWGYYKGDSGKTYIVYRDEYTDTPYTNVNGNQIYGDTRPQSEDEYYYFPFFIVSGDTSIYDVNAYEFFDKNKYKWFPRVRPSSSADTKEFIYYDGYTYEVSDSGTVYVKYDLYTKMIGEFDNEEGVFFIDKDQNVYSVNDYGSLDEEDGYTIDMTNKEATRIVDETIDVYERGIVSGTGISRFTEFRSNAFLTDDTGDPLEGIYDVSEKTNHQPPEGETLDLLFDVGNVANIVPKDRDNELYQGDMITDMEFYYVSKGGYRQESKSWATSSLDTIKSLENTDDYATYSADTDIDVVYCDVTYVVGATLKGTVKTKRYDAIDLNVGRTYALAEGENHGIKYTETVRFVKSECEYKLQLGKGGQIPTTFNTASANTLSYPIKCYILEQDNEDLGSGYKMPVAKFELNADSNNKEVFPVFREEHKLGVSVTQKVESNIYIDRGINAAFEKHLKLGEVTSMEDLEQYTNGYFDFINY